MPQYVNVQISGNTRNVRNGGRAPARLTRMRSSSPSSARPRRRPGEGRSVTRSSISRAVRAEASVQQPPRRRKVGARRASPSSAGVVRSPGLSQTSSIWGPFAGMSQAVSRALWGNTGIRQGR
jgi:hypothetical protein